MISGLKRGSQRRLLETFFCRYKKYQTNIMLLCGLGMTEEGLQLRATMHCGFISTNIFLLYTSICCLGAPEARLLNIHNALCHCGIMPN
jgi:hypothetical protein